MAIGLIGILLSLALLVYTSYKGYNTVLAAPACALFAALFSVSLLELVPVLSEIYMVRAASFVKGYFLIFLVGSLFGKIMEETGLARDIGLSIVRKAGPKGAMFAIILSCVILIYGGILVFICAFALYPLAAAVFREAGIPKRLLTGTICGGCMTAAMTSLPGTPQVQNIIPTQYLGTTAYAAPVLGTVTGLVMLVLVWMWMEYRVKQARLAGEGYGTGHINEPSADVLEDKSGKPFYIAVLPLVTLLVLNYIFTIWIKSWPSEVVESYGLASTANSAATWALFLASVIACILAVIIGWKKIGSQQKLMSVINTGATGSLSAILFVASVVGYGGVISSLPAYSNVANALMNINSSGTPLLSEWLAVNVLSGITGSATGGLGIALSMMGEHYLEWANAVGMSPEILHRVASMASGGLDTLPHCGGVIVVLTVTGLTHKQSYSDVAVTSVVIPFFVTLIAVLAINLFGLY